MSVYVGIDVHRKRSQVAVINQDGKVLARPQRFPNGVTPILSVIGGLPAGTKAAFGWGWLVELLEDYGFEPHLVHPLQCKAIASARLKNDPLTELTTAVDQVSGRAGGLVANVARHDHRRRFAAGLVPAGGAVARVA
jgi:transposase